jgi:hypothetical protein
MNQLSVSVVSSQYETLEWSPDVFREREPAAALLVRSDN